MSTRTPISRTLPRLQTRPAISLDSQIRIPESVVFKELNGEMVLLHLETGMYFGLDPVGTRIWQLIRGHHSLREIHDALVEEYEVPRSRCGNDLITFVTLLQEKELIEIHR